MTPYDLFYLLFRNKWLIAACAVLGLIAVAAAYTYKPRLYRSEARLLVRYVSETVIVNPAASGANVITPGLPSESLIATELDILTSAGLIATVASDLANTPVGGTNLPALTPRRMAENFRVSAGNKSNTIWLNFDGPTPALAQDALRRLIDVYLEKHQEVHRDPGAFEFISRQTDEMRTRVNDTEEELRRLRVQAGIVSASESRELVLQRLQELDRAMRETESTLAATRARQQSLEAQLGGGAPVATPADDEPAPLPPSASLPPLSPADAETLNRLAELYRRESQLLETYTSNSVPVRSLRRQIATLEDKMEQPRLESPASDERPRVAAASYPSASPLSTDLASYRAEEAALRAQMDVLKRQFESARADLLRVESSEVQIGRLERTREVYDNNYRYFSQRLEQARIDSAMDASKVSNIAIVQSPTLPDRPISREMIKLIGLILAVSVGGGVGLAAMREYVFDHRIRHPHEIPRDLRLPLLATIPRIPKHGRRGRRGEERSDRTLESGCEMVAQLLLAQAEQGTNTLLVGFVAPHAGAGVTTLAERVAHAMQRSGLKKVMLASVAADGRFVGKLLGEIETSAEERAEQGMGLEQGVQTMAEERYPVKVAYASPMAITPGVFAEFTRHEYDCVLFDLPPLMRSEMAIRLLPRLNGVILVLETLRTTRAEARMCTEQLEQLNCGIYGAVLNRFWTPLPSWVSPPKAPGPMAHAEQASSQGGV